MATTNTKAVFNKVDSSKLSELTVYPKAEEFTDGGSASGVGYIYIISEKSHGNDTRFYKIGRTVDVQDRIESLQTGNARFLQVYGTVTVNNMAAAEYAAHDAVSQYRATDGGGKEWFYVPPANFKEFVSLAEQAITPYV